MNVLISTFEVASKAFTGFPACRWASLPLLAGLAALSIAASSGTVRADGSIDNTEFCVDATHFRFMVDFSDPAVGDADHTSMTMVFRIGADAPVFGSPDLERISVNFDAETGSISLGPLVEMFGAPLDRWLNEDPITDFTLKQFGTGAYRVEGSVPNGTQPFVAGDKVNQVVLREISSHLGSVDAVFDTVPVYPCDSKIGDDVTLGSGVTLGNGIVIEDGATIGDFTEIRDGAFVGENVVIGANSLLDVNTEVDDDAIIGENCSIRSVINHIFHPAMVAKEANVGAGCDLAGGTVIGRGAIIGERFATTSEFFNEIENTVLISVDVQRGATIGDDVTLDFGTVVGRGANLGDGIGTTTVINHIWHPVVFEQNTAIGSGGQYAGGTRVKPQSSVGTDAAVGENVFIGTKAVVGNNVTLGSDVRIQPGAVVGDNEIVDSGTIVY